MTLANSVVVVLIALAHVSKASASNEPALPREAWVGVAPGSLGPTSVRDLEVRLVDEFAARREIDLVDARGHALGPRLVEEERMEMAHMAERGAEAYLSFDFVRAVRAFDEALRFFERRLAVREDHRAFDAALVAKAEAELRAGRPAAAERTLHALAVRDPAHGPEEGMHAGDLVTKWNAIREALAPVGSLAVETREAGWQVWLDGRSLGRAPLERMRVLPGPHQLVARASFGFEMQTVDVASGRETRVALGTSDNERTRRSCLDAIAQSAGLADVRACISRIRREADAVGTIVAAVRKDVDDRSWLIVASFAVSDLPTKSVAIVIDARDRTLVSESRLHELSRAFDGAKDKGEFVLDPDGTLVEAAGVFDLMHSSRRPPGGVWDRASSTAVAVDALDPSNESRADDDGGDEALASKWWFWVVLVAAAIGAASVVAVVVRGASDREER